MTRTTTTQRVTQTIAIAAASAALLAGCGAGNDDTAESFRSSTATGRGGHALPLDEVGSTAYQTRNHA